jgi:hypothetical protein
MPLEFINNESLLNDGVRKWIRRHAALGRNKGKKLRRTSRKASSTGMTLLRKPAAIQGIADVAQKWCDIERPVDNGLFFPGFQPGVSKVLVKKGMSVIRQIRRHLQYLTLVHATA